MLGLADAEPTFLVVVCCCWLLGVTMDVTMTTAGVSPARVGVGVIVRTDVCTSVCEGGADEAVTVDVVTGGGCELAGGGRAED